MSKKFYRDLEDAMMDPATGPEEIAELLEMAQDGPEDEDKGEDEEGPINLEAAKRVRDAREALLKKRFQAHLRAKYKDLLNAKPSPD